MMLRNEEMQSQAYFQAIDRVYPNDVNTHIGSGMSSADTWGRLMSTVSPLVRVVSAPS
jgi:hypothetical protein